MTDDASRVWAEDMSAAYDEFLVPAVFSPYAKDLAARVARHRPRDVLELAAGTGVLTGEMTALLPQASIVATDLNVAMVDVGSVRVPTATWQQADAMQLDFDDASFDVVACQFGVMFLPDRPAGYTGIARVLKPGGHFLFNCWGPLATHDIEAAVIATLAECFPDDPPTFLARVPHGYHDPERVSADLTAGGFSDIQIETVEMDCAGKTADELARGYCRGTPLRPEIAARGDLDDVAATLAEALRARFGAGPIVGRMAALVASGVTSRA